MSDYNQEIRQERREKRRRQKLIALLAILLLGGGLLYTTFFTDVFRFAEVRLDGTTSLSRDDLWSGKNPLLFQAINIKNPLVASFSVNRNFARRELEVDITERKSYAVWCTSAALSTIAEECFWFDETGFLFISAPMSEGALVKSVYDYSWRSLKAGEKVLPEKELGTVFKIFSSLDESGIAVLKYSLLSLESQEFHALTREGTNIYFNLRLDQDFIEEPLESLKSQLGKLEYIDLRSENRVFYK